MILVLFGLKFARIFTKMGKRTAEQEEPQKVARTSKTDAPTKVPDDDQDEQMDLGIEGGIEGRVGDDYESEEEIVEVGNEDDNDIKMDDDNAASFEKSKQKAEQLVAKEKGDETGKRQIYIPSKSRPLGPDEVLEPDPSVYEMFHNVNLPWPCMTVDVLPDKLGDERRSFPMTMYAVTATQASREKDNEMIVMKLSSLRKTLEKSEDEEYDEDDDDDDDNDFSSDPILESELIPLRSTTNRLRVCPNALRTGHYYTATMHENGEVCIFDIRDQMKAFDTPGFTIPKPSHRPLQIVKSHGNVEGYGLAWSPLEQDGALLSGDVSGRIYLTKNTGSRWSTDKLAYQANDSSIEDIQWSPSEKTVFATAGVDGHLRIWDTRSKKHHPALSIQASQSDVNVISWCGKLDYLLASGHDDGSWGVWDLRNFKPHTQPTPVVSYDFHKSPITSISFNPLDESIVSVSSEDNTVTLWDLAVEADDEEVQQQKAANKDLNDIPAQLMFVHWQKDVKDVRWHQQIPGTLISTGTDGLNVWKTISV